MEDARNVCCMCGDIGFPDKLFQCLRCLFRFQHSYCSNNYSPDSPAAPPAGLCNWCRTEDYHPTDTRPPAAARHKPGPHTHDPDEGSAAGTRGRTSSSAKHAGRRYKLLKDVLC